MSERRISERVTVGGQVSENEVKVLADEGFRTVINLREPEEEDQPVSPDTEARLVEEAGLA